MDDSGRTKYPVLFRVYGGPGSQMVDVRFQQDWHAYLVTELQYIVVVVDGRGTGFKGRRLRNPVKDNLGHWETIDQIYAAKCVLSCRSYITADGRLTLWFRLWASKDYVDPKRIGIWGWVRFLSHWPSRNVSLPVTIVIWRLHELQGCRSKCGRALPRHGRRCKFLSITSELSLT